MAVQTGAGAALTTLDMITFGGASNLPLWLAQERGLFAREGLEIVLAATKGSIPQMQAMMEGKYQLAATSIDNVMAYTEGQGDVPIETFDLVAFAGVHSGLNSVVARPEIKSYRDIEGKTVAVDALGTGYAFLLFRILADHGLVLGHDYRALSVGGGPERLEALQKGDAVAAVMAAPNNIEARHLGYSILAEDAALAVGSYQGSVYAARRSWAAAHEREILAFIRAVAAAHELVRSDRAGALDCLKSRIKTLSARDAEEIYYGLAGEGGLNRRAELNIDGIRTTLALRSDYAKPQKRLTDPMKYVDLAYHRKALA